MEKDEVELKLKAIDLDESPADMKAAVVREVTLSAVGAVVGAMVSTTVAFMVTRGLKRAAIKYDAWRESQPKTEESD